MNQPIPYQTILSRLEENHLAYEVLQTPSGLSFLLLERGGRILGPFIHENQAGLFWVNQAFASVESFSSFLRRGEWNLGGERLWIAPELQYNISNRYDFDGSYSLPKQMDPGSYRLTNEGEQHFLFSMSLILEARILAIGKKNLQVQCDVQLCADPLRKIEQYDEIK